MNELQLAALFLGGVTVGTVLVLLFLHPLPRRRSEIILPSGRRYEVVADEPPTDGDCYQFQFRGHRLGLAEVGQAWADLLPAASARAEHFGLDRLRMVAQITESSDTGAVLRLEAAEYYRGSNGAWHRTTAR